MTAWLHMSKRSARGRGSPLIVAKATECVAAKCREGPRGPSTVIIVFDKSRGAKAAAMHLIESRVLEATKEPNGLDPLFDHRDVAHGLTTLKLCDANFRSSCQSSITQVPGTSSQELSKCQPM